VAGLLGALYWVTRIPGDEATARLTALSAESYVEVRSVSNRKFLGLRIGGSGRMNVIRSPHTCRHTFQLCRRANWDQGGRPTAAPGLRRVLALLVWLNKRPWRLYTAA
ncbi:unnamed protein product, partial [Ectocarpus sp. 12 AP-2014]